MSLNPRDVINILNTNEIDTFISKTSSTFSVNKNVKEVNVDYSWLYVLENTLGNIDKIVRNPRRFIVQEEDIVIVEKVKKISQETIQHLAEHSENIRDIDEDGNVMPEKLLNVHKEDTTDLYENRFIYTLVKRLENFIERQLKDLDVVSLRETKKDAIYKASSEYDNKKASIEVKINYESVDELNKDGKSLRDRILACYDIISGFGTTEMIKDLIGCSPVRNPIRKTNLILREPNFQKAFLLWEQLDNFEFKDPKVVKYENSKESDDETRNEFDLSFFVDCNALDENQDNILKFKDLDSKLSKVIDEYIYDSKDSLDVLVDKLKKYYDINLKEKQNKERIISAILNKFIKSHNELISSINDIVH